MTGISPSRQNRTRHEGGNWTEGRREATDSIRKVATQTREEESAQTRDLPERMTVSWCWTVR